MTFDDCKKALEWESELRKLQALRKEQSHRDFVSTKDIKTGRGTETMSFSIPWETIDQMISSRIDYIKEQLEHMGVSEAQDEKGN
jgi:hypothetical protein